MSRVVKILLCILGVGLAFAMGWSLRASGPAPADRSHRQEGSARAPTVEVEAVHVRRTDLSLRAEATGYLQAWRRVEIHAEIAGRVSRRAIEEGAQVQAGTLLVELDDRDRRFDLKDAQAAWLKSQATYAVDFSAGGEEKKKESGSGPAAAGTASQAAADPERLHRDGLISAQRLEEMRRSEESSRLLSGSRRGEVRAAQNGLAQAEQQVERCRIALERTRIAAPFPGRVADLNVELGQQISPGESLLTLLEDDRLKVDVDVLEADLVWLRPGAPAEVHIPSLGNLALPGTIATITPRVKTETGTGRVTIAIANPQHRLVTGLFATVRLETRKLPGQLVVPARAVLIRQGRELVFRVDHGKALWTYVKLGARSGDLVAIAEGLKEGDVVAVGGHFALAHETPVSPLLVDGRTAAKPAVEEPWNPSSAH
ncbi:MAG TPA: efflux RND transporter periplasmic adaptor subunit [Thermoanaerobaculia bacterium]|jgi:HlyD family secretion protein|nr:efflux RND transporter periplasmic adaptor subunit [Thermoanaerobaculia bacterium]